jgi:cytoskeleton protein RodZ
VVESPAKPPEDAGAPEGAPAAKPRSIGERLRAGRDKAGLSLLAAAEKLHLDPKVIEALEADRFAELGAPVYVRGHLKRYAEFVGENAIELLNLHGAREARPAPPDLTQIPHAEKRADPRRLLPPLAMFASAAALALSIWWVLSRPEPSGPPAASVEPPKELVPADGSPVIGAGNIVTATPAAMDAGPSASTTAGSATPLVVPERVSAADGAAQPQAMVAEPREAPAVRDVQLRLDLVTESWVEVYDSRGERLYFDVASAGSVQSITGRAPLRVFLGNAAGVRVEVDGQPRDIPGSTLDGDGARFVVNRSGTLSRAR